MKFSHLSALFLLVAFLSLLLGILTAIGLLPIFLFNVTPRGFLSFTYTALMFAITLILWELRDRMNKP